MEYSVIGKRVQKVDAAAKATGEGKFVADMFLPGMIYGKILRSTRPHAKILNIDLEKAKRLQGVKAVITSEDVPDVRYGALVMDMGILARGKVRYIGEPVAAVAAVDEDTALEALELIKVEYEDLPAVFDPLESLEPGAPVIHEDLKSYLTLFPRTDKSMSGNLNYHTVIHQGDIETGFAKSETIFEDTFRTSKVHASYIEPHGTLAAFDSDRVTVWTTTQRPHINQAIVSSVLNIVPLSRVRVIPCHVGGAFGGKARTFLEPIAVALSQRAKAPVKMALTREEELSCTTTRHPAIITLKTGVRKDGTLVACRVDAVYDAGAYAVTPNAVWLGAVTSVGPYRAEHARIEFSSVYTNKMMSGAFRGYGIPQVIFARESQLDRMARELGVDPVEIRLKNCLKPGDMLPTGQKVTSCNIEGTIRTAAEKIGWGKAQGQANRSFGISCGFTPCGGFATGSFVRLHQDGTCLVSCGAMDMGQGLKTVMAQLVAETLGLYVEDITVLIGDTDSTPFDVGVFGDRGTYTGGTATRMAAEDARSQILDLAVERLEANRTDLVLRDRKVFVKGSPERSLTFRELLGGGSYKKGAQVIGKASINPDSLPMDIKIVQGAASRFFSTYTYATNIADVELDRKTGEITVHRAVGVQDCGNVINPDGAEGQIDGGMAIALGWGLYEDLPIKDGQVLNPNFLEYKIPTALDMPKITRAMVESYDDGGPFGAKGVANASTVGMAPAIANAVFSITGKQVKDLPITPEKVVTLMKE